MYQRLEKSTFSTSSVCIYIRKSEQEKEREAREKHKYKPKREIKTKFSEFS